MDVAIMVCRRSALSPFQPVTVMTVAISVCRRFHCRRFGSFKVDVDVTVCHRFGLSSFQPVTVSTVTV